MKGARRRVIWREVAEADLAEAYLYIGADSPEAAERMLDAAERMLDAAERMLDAVGETVSLLLENPYAGSPKEFRSPRAQGIRSWAPQGFPNLLIFYRVNGGDIEVVRFLHGARDLPRHLEKDA